MIESFVYVMVAVVAAAGILMLCAAAIGRRADARAYEAFLLRRKEWLKPEPENLPRKKSRAFSERGEERVYLAKQRRFLDARADPDSMMALMRDAMVDERLPDAIETGREVYRILNHLRECPGTPVAELGSNQAVELCRHWGLGQMVGPRMVLTTAGHAMVEVLKQRDMTERREGMRS